MACFKITFLYIVFAFNLIQLHLRLSRASGRECTSSFQKQNEENVRINKTHEMTAKVFLLSAVAKEDTK